MRLAIYFPKTKREARNHFGGETTATGFPRTVCGCFETFLCLSGFTGEKVPLNCRIAAFCPLTSQSSETFPPNGPSYSYGSFILQVWYVSLALSKELTLLWIQQVKDVLWICCEFLKLLKVQTGPISVAWIFLGAFFLLLLALQYVSFSTFWGFIFVARYLARFKTGKFAPHDAGDFYGHLYLENPAGKRCVCRILPLDAALFAKKNSTAWLRREVVAEFFSLGLSAGEALRHAMNRICANIMGHLNQKGFYSVLQVCGVWLPLSSSA